MTVDRASKPVTLMPLLAATLEEPGSALADRPYASRGVAATDATIRVILVDDHTLMRQGLHALLRTAPDIVVVGEADSGPAALSLAERVSPDVVVMDLDMPEGDGASTTRTLVTNGNPARVLVLTMHTEDEHLIPLLEQGARGFLTKEAAHSDLLEAIRVVAAGDIYVRPSIARMLAARIRPVTRRTTVDSMRDQFASLSKRERSVLQLVAEGYNGPEVGELLGITAKTVDTYKQRIAVKIGLTHRSGYVTFAASIGSLPGQYIENATTTPQPDVPTPAHSSLALQRPPRGRLL